ncbi:hypothetical protein GCM10009687_62210 [Asanoa iriomotensis]|uniref:Carboxypeptidase regulatory-like domain-containing protein n=1 Tax=Asanoa iriomotensis TaxID=234613 RepID=A0ABQ4CEU5_9ACTN|nr:hypothetical protein Air01nite_69300 [Asanoa iriomotensis]
MSISVSNGSLSPGENANVRISIKNNNPSDNPGNNRQTATVRVTTSFGELSCSQNCDGDIDINAGDTEEVTARVTAGNVPDGQTKAGQVIVQVSINGENAQATRDMTVRGKQVQAPPPTETVKTISGKVINQADGKPVNGAYVALSDGNSQTHETIASSNGTFRFNGSERNPIAPGRITIGASKDEIKVTKAITVNAGQSSTGVTLSLQLTAAASPSGTPVPTEEAPLDDELTDEPSDSAIAANPAGNTDEGGGFGNWLVVLGGGLLVAFGVGGIVWVMLRRKENDDPDDATSTTGVRPAAPMGGAAAYRGGGNDATRIAGPGGGPMADAPTMLHSRAPMDEFPDPYGAPMPAQAPTYGQQQPGWDAGGAGGYGASQPTQVGGYDQATQMYGGAAPTQFGNAPGSGGGYGAGGGYGDAPGSGAGGYGGAPASGGGYGAGPAGYPQSGGGGYGDQRFDEPTGRYEPASGGDGYGGRDNGYGGGAGNSGYGAGGGNNGYGGAPASGGGYGDDRGYGAEPNGYDQGGANGYGSAPRGGYDQQGRGGYEGGGYGGQQGGGYDDTRGYPAGGGDYGRGGGYEGGGYDRVPEQRGGGAYGGNQNAGYDDRGDYYDGQGQQNNGGEGRARHGGGGGRGGDRRELGWLDD